MKAAAILIGRMGALVGVLLVTAAVGLHLVSAGEPAATPDKPVPPRPVTISVVDAKTGKPIPEFSYSWRIETPDGEERELGKWKPWKSPDGKLVIRGVPISCELTVGLEAAGYIQEYGTKFWPTFLVKSDYPERRFVARLSPGIRLTGVVKDAQTKRPIEGVRVAPVEFHAPAFDPDLSRAVKTGRDGKFAFELIADGQSINVFHDDYLEQRVLWNPHDGMEILLRKGAELRGRVHDAQGKPIEGVLVLADGKGASTDEDGRFVLKGVTPDMGRMPRDRFIEFSKKGYNNHTVEIEGLPGEPIVVTIKPLPELSLRGRVLAPRGEPLTSYAVSVGPGDCPGRNQSFTVGVDDGQGEFSIDLDWQGKYWVGVRADGFAVWEGWTRVAEDAEPMTIRLKPGVTVRGTFTEGFSADRKPQATLSPHREVDRFAPEGWAQRLMTPDYSALLDVPEQPEEERGPVALATREAAVADDGSFRFEHVRPDNCVLTIEGPGIMPQRLLVVVPEEGRDLGEIPLDAWQATGRIVGQVYHPKDRHGGGTWSFAEGIAAHGAWVRPRGGDSSQRPAPPDQHKEFKADEAGRFSVEGVPPGVAVVSFDHWVTADILGSYTRAVRVVENQETEVRFFDPSGQWDLGLEIVVGDGSEEHFRCGAGLAPKTAEEDDATPAAPDWQPIEDQTVGFGVCLEPRTQERISWPVSDTSFLILWPDRCRGAVPDVHAGEYRLKLLRYGTVLHEADVDVPEHNRQPLRVALPAASVVQRPTPDPTPPGRRDANRESPRESFGLESVLVPEDGSTAPRSLWHWHYEGCTFPFVTPGKYRLYVYDSGGRWGLLENVRVRQGHVTEVGLPPLVRGATVTGKAVLHTERRIPTDVVATDAHGVRREARDFYGLNGEQYSIAGLWPGEWTVTLRSESEVLASRKVVIRGAETAHAELVGK